MTELEKRLIPFREKAKQMTEDIKNSFDDRMSVVKDEFKKANCELNYEWV